MTLRTDLVHPSTSGLLDCLPVSTGCHRNHNSVLSGTSQWSPRHLHCLMYRRANHKGGVERQPRPCPQTSFDHRVSISAHTKWYVHITHRLSLEPCLLDTSQRPHHHHIASCLNERIMRDEWKYGVDLACRHRSQAVLRHAQDGYTVLQRLNFIWI